LMEN